VCQKHIVLPFASEAEYGACLADLTRFRAWLVAQYTAHPALFPAEFAAGFDWHDSYRLKKLDLVVRRLKLRATGTVWTVRPSFALPYGVGRTDEVEKALYLRQFGVPFEALAYVFGRSASYWERLWLALGRHSVVGTTVKDASRLPRQLVADEKISWRNGAEVCVTATAGGGCLLGLGLAEDVTAEALATA
jgi:hypothetical protein